MSELARYIVQWRECAGDPLRQQKCTTRAEAGEWSAAARACGAVDVAVLPEVQLRLRQPKRMQIIDPEGRLWNPRTETFQTLVSEVNQLLK